MSEQRAEGAVADMFPEVQPHLGVEDDNQRFTIRRALDWCRTKAGVTEYDLDAAACEESHHAPTWYGWKPRPWKLQHEAGLATPGLELHDGLKLPWFGDVFVNPPWDDIFPWVWRAWKAWNEPVFDKLSLISVSMLVPANRTHRPWWQELVEPFRDGRRQMGDGLSLDVHFAPERFPYGAPGNPQGLGVAEPNFTSVLLVWRGDSQTSAARRSP